MSMAELEAAWPAMLVTRRLLLRPIQPEDMADLSRLWTDPAVRRYLGGPVLPDEVATRQRESINKPGQFCVLRAADNAVVGRVIIDPESRDGKTEVSYELLPDHWGQGCGREAVAAAAACTR